MMSCRNYLTGAHIISFLCFTAIHQNQIFYTWFYQHSLTNFFRDDHALYKLISLMPETDSRYWSQCIMPMPNTNFMHWRPVLMHDVDASNIRLQKRYPILISQFSQSPNFGCILMWLQLFSLMLHKNASDKFSFENCKFTIQRSKESTGR